jgi:HSP20 family protein
MAIRDLIPWRKERVPVRRQEQEPFLTLQQEMNRMFDEFLGDWGAQLPALWREPWTSFSPRVDVTETEEEVRVEAELPGLDAEDIDVSLSRNVLTISGEKKHEKEEREKGYYRSERTYGAFKRSLTLPEAVDFNRANATFEKGVLTIAFPKTAQAQERKKIEVKTS